VFLAGVVAGIGSYRRENREALDELVASARRCAVAFQGDELRQLAAVPADQGKPAYVAIKARLVELRRIEPRVRFVYIFRQVPGTNRVVFVADSEPVGSADQSLPGDDFPESVNSPGLQAVLATGRPATEGPLSDRFGTWITAYAPVPRTASALADADTDLLGLDMDAGHWQAHLTGRALQSAFYVWLLLGLPLAVPAILRRWSAQQRTILQLSEAVEQSRSAMMITGLDSRIEYVNRGLCEQLGYTAGELIGRNWNEFRTGATPPALLADMIATVRAGRSWGGEWINRRKSGELYPVSGVISPVVGGPGRILCFIAVLSDMTEVKRSEAELRTAKERAEAGERAKGEFLDTMSHELRTPLNGIVGFTSLLLETPLSSEQREYVQTVRFSGEALLKLTGDILDYSRMESHPLPLEPEPCEVRALVEDVLDLLACMAGIKKIELLHDIGPEVPALAMLDPGRLRQVLVNLIGNAVKFTEKGEVEVRVRARLSVSPAGGGLWLDFEVRDTGSGISEADQRRLFQPFSQLDSTTHRRHDGTGLGLAISRALVKLMGGEIALRSKPGSGSVFAFTVPAKPIEPQVELLALAGRRVGVVADSAALMRELMRVIAMAGGAPVPCQLEEIAMKSVDLAIVDCDRGVVAKELEGVIEPSVWPKGGVFGLVTGEMATEDRRRLRGHFRSLLNKPIRHAALIQALVSGVHKAERVAPHAQFGLRVLVVDDNPVNLRLLQSILTLLGCSNVAVSGGAAALDALMHGGTFDLVMLDLRMPDLDGSEVLRRIRAGEVGEDLRSIWVTIVTAESREKAGAELFAAGCNDFVTKPITLASCVAALQCRQRQKRL
jgi:PAS domain S-box-containing protein